MPENDYGSYGQERERITTNPIRRVPRRNNFFVPNEEIEFIDLDAGREQIKPTTWH